MVLSGFELHRNGITQIYLLLCGASLIQYSGVSIAVGGLSLIILTAMQYSTIYRSILSLIDVCWGGFLQFLMGKHCYEYFYISFWGTWGVILESFKFIGYIFDNFEWNLKLYLFFLFSVYSFINSWDHPLYMFYV